MGVERARVVIVGGGVVGCSILWEFTRRGVPGLLLESQPDVCEGTSKANSGIVHTGFDARAGSLESRMLVEARSLWPAVVDELGVPFLPIGAIMLASTDEETARLRTVVAANAARMGVSVEVLDGPAVRSMAPYVTSDVSSALSIPGESVVDPFWLTRAFAEAAIAGGSEIRLRQQVVGMRVEPDGMAIDTSDGHRLAADQVIDAAGLRADEVAALVGDRSFSIRPRKGQFLVAEETYGVDRIVLPIPGPGGKGMLVTPIVFGGLLLGPTAEDGTDKEDEGVDPVSRQNILDRCRAMVPAIGSVRPVRQFAGLRHVSSSGDFIVRPSTVTDRLFLVAGIRSTGISTSPAIARTVVTAVASLRGWPLMERRRLPPPPITIRAEAGEIVCLCRSISRSEIDAAIARPMDPDTLDGIKRRSGAMFGDCQGNLCAVDIGEILAAARGRPVAALELHRAGSWLWGQRPRATASRQPVSVVSGTPTIGWDVVIVGGGHAGRAAATALEDDVRVLVLERSHGAGPVDGRRITTRASVVTGVTVTGITPGPAGWAILGQAPGGTIEVSAPTVILATGGYDRPAEHRGIAGTRPSGVMTADRAWRCLAAGLLPGRMLLLVGANDRADRLATELSIAGARVLRLHEPPVELRGRDRLDAVRTRTGWQEADGLIFADELMAQTFLLRGLGLVDGTPGRPAPADGDGRLPPAGLWAAGCCVEPDPAHVGCAVRGDRVGRNVGDALRSTIGMQAADQPR